MATLRRRAAVGLVGFIAVLRERERQTEGGKFKVEEETWMTGHGEEGEEEAAGRGQSLRK